MKKAVLFIYLLISICLIICGLELAQGCDVDCMGPAGPYWTFWGYVLQHQIFAFIPAGLLATASAAFGVFRKWNRFTLCIIILATFLYGLSAYVYFNPMIYQY